MKDLRILLVEDEPVVALDVRKRLENLGYPEPFVVRSGEDAVQFTMQSSPDLVLMDIVLSGKMDGIEAATQLREVAPVPIIYMTGHDDSATLRRANVTEPFGYLIKPFENRELRVCMEMALYKHDMDKDAKRKEDVFAATLANIGDAVFSLDNDGNIIFINAAAEHMLGQSRFDIVGRDFASSVRLRDEANGYFISTQQAVCQNSCEFAQPTPATVVLADDTTIPVDLTVSCVGAMGAEGSVVVLRDATDRKRSETVLRSSLDELRKTFEQTVSALTLASEKRDPYTAGHQQRVSGLATAIAEQLRLRPKQIDAVRVAGLLHDLGKIYIPAEILAKPGVLSPLEMEMIKTHPQVGYDILREVTFPWPVAEIVLQHHERLDGSGYPNGVLGEAISIEARILAVADVVEAMSSHRPYRASLGMEAALTEVQRGRGSIYDADVVDACAAVIANGFSLETLD